MVGRIARRAAAASGGWGAPLASARGVGTAAASAADDAAWRPMACRRTGGLASAGTPLPTLGWDPRDPLGAAALLMHSLPSIAPGASCPSVRSPLLEADVIDVDVDGEAARDALHLVKRTFQPSLLKRKRRHGFLKRKSTPGGRRVLKRRLLKRRWRISA